MPRALNDWIRNFELYTDNTEPPVLYRTWAAVSTIAAALQRKCCLPWGSLTFYPNFYIILVGPPAARKGTAMGPAQDFLYDLDIKMASEAITREALIRELKNANDNIIDPSTGTVSYHSSLTVFSPELTVFLGYNNPQLLSDLTDWFDCRKRWVYRTKTQGTDEIFGVFVNIFGATTPDLIRATMPLDAIGGGLTSRMIFVYEEGQGKIVPAPFFSPSERILRDKLQEDLERIYLLRGEFRPTEEFLEVWIDWYTKQGENPPFHDKRFDGYLARRPMHLIKLSMILNASRTDNMILESCDLENALHLLERTEIKMPKTFAGVGASSTGGILAQVMAEIGNRKIMTFSELLMLFHQDVDKRTLEAMIETLESMRFAKRSYSGGPEGEITIKYIKE